MKVQLKLFRSTACFGDRIPFACSTSAVNGSRTYSAISLPHSKSAHLTYKEVASDPARPDWQTFRLALFLDRCSHRVSNISKYVP